MKVMFAIALFVGIVASSSAIVCVPFLCEGVKQEELNCAGSVIKGGGFCGCTDVCAKQEGEGCGHRDHTMSLGQCEEGLTCTPGGSMLLGLGVCKANKGSRNIYEPSKCEKERIRVSLEALVHHVKWVPICEPDGSFFRSQCDSEGMCFCVDKTTGVIDQSTKVKGLPQC